MPIWLRKFTFEKIKEFYEKEREEANKQNNMLKNKQGDISRPNIAPKQPPTYISKAPTKK